MSCAGISAPVAQGVGVGWGSDGVVLPRLGDERGGGKRGEACTVLSEIELYVGFLRGGEKECFVSQVGVRAVGAKLAFGEGVGREILLQFCGMHVVVFDMALFISFKSFTSLVFCHDVDVVVLIWNSANFLSPSLPITCSRTADLCSLSPFVFERFAVLLLWGVQTETDTGV